MATELSAPPGMGRCEVTGQVVPEDELVLIHGQRVCAEGKAILLERLKAGEAMPGEPERPTILRRFGCIFLDSIILGVVYIATALVAGLSLLTAAPKSFMVVGIVQLVVAVISVGYFSLMHGTRGQTVGKMAGKLRVIRVDGRPMDLQTGFIRALGYHGLNLVAAALTLTGVPALQMTASGIVLVYLLANVVVALCDRSQQRAIHDHIAGTRVVNIPTV